MSESHLTFRKFCRVVLPILLLFLNGCATNPKETVGFDAAVAGKFSARSEPAILTKESEATLVNKGYFKLGTISASYNTKVCEDGRCESLAHDKSQEQLIRGEAAKHGGDVVRLEQSNAAGSRREAKSGRCLQESSRTEYYQVNNQECEYDTNGHVRWCHPNYEMKSRTVNTCTQYEQIPITIDTVSSYGTVWRHDPALVSSDRAFQKALTGGSVVELEKLLARRSSITEPLLDGRRPISVAVQAGNSPAVRLLLSKGAKPDQSDVQMAINKRYGEVSSLLIKQGAIKGSNASSNSQATFWSASAMGQTKAVEASLGSGANINLRDPADGQNALHKAAWGCHLETVKTLLARGIDRRATTADGERAIDLARSSSNWNKRTPSEQAECREIVNLLMK